MGTKLHTYVPLEIKVIFKGTEARGITKGTFCTVKRSQPMWSMTMSGDGQDATRVQSLDKSGVVEVTLDAGSETNKLYSNILKSDEVNKDGVGALTVQDLNGNDLHTSEKAFLLGYTEVEYGENAGARRYMIQCVELVTFSGGSADA
jgi:hypothetical protein